MALVSLLICQRVQHVIITDSREFERSGVLRTPMRVTSNFINTGQVVCKLKMEKHKHLYTRRSHIRSPPSWALWWKISQSGAFPQFLICRAIKYKSIQEVWHTHFPSDREVKLLCRPGCVEGHLKSLTPEQGRGELPAEPCRMTPPPPLQGPYY